MSHVSVALPALFSIFTFCMPHAEAAPRGAPPSFRPPGASANAVFVDFLEARYSVTFDIPGKATWVRSTIVFQSAEAGMPVFDLIDSPDEVTLDGQPAEQAEVKTPVVAGDREKYQTIVRVVKRSVEAGRHELVIKHRMTVSHGPTFADSKVNTGFFMSDMDARGLLERYLPSNYEFDRVAMSLDVEFVGLKHEQLVITNGTMERTKANHWKIVFPDYFNCSSVYFHTVPKEDVKTLAFTIDGLAGRIPGLIYTKKNHDLEQFARESTQAIHDYETRFGPWPHASVIVYAQSAGGGMEYSGATTTEIWAVAHELAHSYFGRGVMPANGNAGWIDEAMASLAGGPDLPNPDKISPTNMSAHSPYFRENDGEGYGQGMNLLAHFDRRMRARSSGLTMDGFFSGWFKGHVHGTTVIEQLAADLEGYMGESVKEDFDTYVFGNGALERLRPAAQPRLRAGMSPVHQRMTLGRFRSLQ